MSTSSILKMSQLNLPAPLVVIAGPTAVGKTEIAIRVAEAIGGEIVSADSRLFYRGMDIGTAKPSLAERLRVPHHLIDVRYPDQVWSLADFQQAAAQAIREVHARGRVPFLVGGTGQYIRAVLQGWDLPPQTPDPALRAALEGWASREGGDRLHHRLALLDPEAAANIDARNVRRTIRALEVILRTGQKFSAQRQRGGSPYSLLVIGLKRPREALYARVDQRIQTMIDVGFVDEVRSLLANGYSPDLPTLSAIGYREMVAFLRGEITLDEAVVQIKRKTRRFVRHQGAWFNEDDPAIHWFEVGPETETQIEALIRDPAAWTLPGALMDM